SLSPTLPIHNLIRNLQNFIESSDNIFKSKEWDQCGANFGADFLDPNETTSIKLRLTIGASYTQGDLLALLIEIPNLIFVSHRHLQTLVAHWETPESVDHHPDLYLDSPAQLWKHLIEVVGSIPKNQPSAAAAASGVDTQTSISQANKQVEQPSGDGDNSDGGATECASATSSTITTTKTTTKRGRRPKNSVTASGPATAQQTKSNDSTEDPVVEKQTADFLADDEDSQAEVGARQLKSWAKYCGISVSGKVDDYRHKLIAELVSRNSRK
ncbi:hypothetical protein P7C70_g9393, partial [Phenoliferia sp. Uapishka_3]